VSPRTVVVVAVSLVWGMVVAVGGYALVRVVQSFVWPDPNPATLVWSAHSGYFWRAWTVGYAGGIASFVAFLVARTQTERAARALGPAVGVVAVMLALQALFVP
jgi:hypothetical protein